LIVSYLHSWQISYSPGRSVYNFKCNNYWLKQGRISSRFYFTKMTVGAFCSFAAAGGAHQKTFLDEERFVNFFDGSFVFAHSGGNGFQAHRAAFKFIDNGGKDLVVHFIQTVLINVECIEGVFGNFRIDTAVAFNLCKIARTAQQGIGNTRGTAAAAGNFISALIADGRF